METRPPQMMERIVRLLLPPVSAEHVMGDLSERYVSPARYLAEAARILPFVIASRLRRTSNLALLGFMAVFLWLGVFHGNTQRTWLVATIPTLVALAALELRDAYRTLTPTWPRQAAVDVAVAAGCVLSSQLVLALMAPQLVLSQGALLLGAPIGCIVLFLVRWQTPSGVYRPPALSRHMSMQELLGEIRAHEALLRRSLHIEMGAGFAVAAIFTTAVWFAAGPIGRIGCALSASGALFVVWFLHRNARVHPLPADLGFAESLAIYRADLERRGKLSRSYAWWYVLPLSVGPALILISPALRQSNPGPSIAVVLSVMVLAGALLTHASQRAAGKLQRRADDLANVKEKQR